MQQTMPLVSVLSQERREERERATDLVVGLCGESLVAEGLELFSLEATTENRQLSRNTESLTGSRLTDDIVVR